MSELVISTLAGHVDGEHWVQLAALNDARQLVGSAHLDHVATDMPTLFDLYVQEGCRRQGIATELVRAAKRWADHAGKELYLHVLPKNPAIALYEREGFEFTGEVKDDGSQWMIRCACDGRLVRGEVASV